MTGLTSSVKSKLGELQCLELEIAATKNLSSEVAASYAYILREKDEEIQNRIAVAVQNCQWDVNFDECLNISKKLWTVLNKASPSINVGKDIDTSDWAAIDKIVREGLPSNKTPATQPKTTTLAQEVRSPIPDRMEQLIPTEGELTGDELDMLLEDAAVAEGMIFEPPIKPASSRSSGASMSTSSSPSTVSPVTTTLGTIGAPEVIQAPEKQFFATKRNTNPAAGQQICMQFISEFARFLRDQSQLNLESIIDTGNQIYKTFKNTPPDMLFCLLKGAPEHVFEPTKQCYLQLLKDLDVSRSQYKGGALPMIGAVLTYQGSSIAIVIALKNKKNHFHIFCPDGNAKLQKKTDAFRKEYTNGDEAADYLAQLHKSIQDASVRGTMQTFIRNQDYRLTGQIKTAGSISSSQSTVVFTTAPVLPLAESIGSRSSSSSSSQSTVVSSTVSSIASVSITKQTFYWHQAQRLQQIQQELAYSEKPAEITKAFLGLKNLTEKTKDKKSTIGSLVLFHLYCMHLQIPGKTALGYSMSNAFQNKVKCTATPEERHKAFNRAIIEVLLDGLETAYQEHDFRTAQSYVSSIGEFCNKCKEGQVKETFPLLHTIISWPPVLTHQVESRLTHLDLVRKLLRKSWGFQ